MWVLKKSNLGIFQHNLQLFTNFAEHPKSSGTVPIWLIYGAMEALLKYASKEYRTCMNCIDKYAENKTSTTVHEKYRDRTADMQHDMLLLLTCLEDNDDLPEYYLGISAKPKGLSERVIFQREVDTAAEFLGLVPFQVTPSQVMTMKSFDFCGPSYSEIGTVILPFSITLADDTSDRGCAAIMADHGRAETYDLS
jgi:hypothetical protein